MNRKQRRASGVPTRREFEQELRRAVDGDPAADRNVADFWGHFARTGDIAAAYVKPSGDLSLIRNSKEDDS